MEMIALRDLWRTYHVGDSDVHALRDVSIEIAKGDYLTGHGKVAPILLVLSILTRAGVIGMLCFLALLTSYHNLKRSYNNPRLVENDILVMLSTTEPPPAQ